MKERKTLESGSHVRDALHRVMDPLGESRESNELPITRTRLIRESYVESVHGMWDGLVHEVGTR